MGSYDLFHAEKSSAQNFCRKVMLWPKQWKSFAWPATLTWHSIEANSAAAKSLPESPGVYVFVITPGIADMGIIGIVGYVGETEGQSLRKRCSKYFHSSEYEVRPHIGEMMYLWKNNLRLWYVETSAVEATKLEDKLLAAFLPPFNRKFPGTFNKLAKSIYHT